MIANLERVNINIVIIHMFALTPSLPPEPCIVHFIMYWTNSINLAAYGMGLYNAKSYCNGFGREGGDIIEKNQRQYCAEKTERRKV